MRILPNDPNTRATPLPTAATARRPAAIPFAANPIPVSTGPTAASPAPAMTMNRCTGGDNSVNLLTSVFAFSARSAMTGAITSPTFSQPVSTAPDSSSIAFCVGPIRAAAALVALPAADVAASYLAMPSAPTFIIAAAPRIASVPKIVSSAFDFSASPSPPNWDFNWPATSVSDFIDPSAFTKFSP